MDNRGANQQLPIWNVEAVPGFDPRTCRWVGSSNTPAAAPPPGIAAGRLRVADTPIDPQLLRDDNTPTTIPPAEKKDHSSYASHTEGGRENQGAEKDTKYSRILSNPQAAVEAQQQRQDGTSYGDPSPHSAAGGPYYVSGQAAATRNFPVRENSEVEPPDQGKTPKKRRKNARKDSLLGSPKTTGGRGRGRGASLPRGGHMGAQDPSKWTGN